MATTQHTPLPLPSPSRPRRWWVEYSILLSVGLAGMAVLFFFDPTGSAGRFFPKCYLHEWTGLHCPGCGATRALHHLAHGRILTALRFNPLVIFIGIPMIVWSLFQQV